MSLKTPSAAHRKGILYMCLSIFLWVAAETIYKTVMHYSFLEVIWIRYATHLLLVLCIVARRRKKELLKTSRPVLQGLRGLMMIGMPVLAVMGARSARAADVLAYWQFAPLLVLILSALVLSEPVRFSRWGATVAAFIGACLMVRIDHVTLNSASLLLIGSAMCFSFYQILSRSLGKEPVLTGLFFTGLAVFLPLSPFQPGIWIPPTTIDFVLMAAIGIVGLALLWAIDKAYALAPASIVAPYAYLLPILVTIEHFAFTGRTPTAWSMFGALVIAGSLLFQFFHR
jgi:drug/metabolite transporter (DMT)-like permease